MNSLKAFLSQVGQGIVKFVDVLNEIYTRPTPCDRCQHEYPLYQVLARTISDPYGVLDHCPYYRHLCSACASELRALVAERTRSLLRERRVPQELAVIKRHNERASRLGLLGTLTLQQWVMTLNFYEWKCAYCGGEYEELDHWIPLASGSKGTTKENCVPACFRCNRKKGPLHPASIGESSLSPAAHRRIEQQLRELHREEAGLPQVDSSSGL